MKPQDLLNYYKDSSLDLTADQVLQELINLGPTAVQPVIMACEAKKISSPATTYKKIDELEASGMIYKGVDPKDSRIRILSVCVKGEERIKKWGKK
jgi:DNA-binding MarR family transcriptional regulator